MHRPLTVRTACLVAALAVAATLGVASPGVAQPVLGGGVASPVQIDRDAPRTIVVVQPGLAETAVASCAGGAAIGYLLVLASGVGSALGTPALFCGLSIAASVASTAAVWTLQSTSALVR
jgi:hypothetical protein